MSLIPMQSGNEAAKMIVRASYSSFALQVQDHCSISKNGSLCFKVSILTFPACLGNQDQSTILNFTYVCLHPRTHTAHTLTHTHCSHPHTHCSHTLLTPSHTLLTPSHTLLTPSDTLLTTLHTHCAHHHTLTPMLSLLSRSCRKILQAAKLQDYQVGKTKVFLKYWHVDKLNELLERVHKAAAILQKSMFIWVAPSSGCSL